MNSKTLVAVTILLILSLLSNLYLLTTKGNQKSVSLNPTFSNTSNSGNFSLPISQNRQGVASAFLVYTFSGKVKELTTTSDNIRVKLDIPGTDLPDFVTTSRTQIIKYPSANSTTPPTQMSTKDVTIGSDVIISMTYHLDTKKWETSGIIIQTQTPSQSTATSSAK